MAQLIIRSAQPSDVAAVFQLIQALAQYEQLSHAVTGNPDALREHLFGPRPYIEAIVAQWENKVVGFALFFSNYSTFLTKPRIYIEDIFVLPDYRRRGIGKAMLNRVAQIAVERGCGRLEWSVLDWNESAIAFYTELGASVLEEWRICRVAQSALIRLAT